MLFTKIDQITLSSFFFHSKNLKAAETSRLRLHQLQSWQYELWELVGTDNQREFHRWYKLSTNLLGNSAKIEKNKDFTLCFIIWYKIKIIVRL
jgi:nicotinic acid mononucleotide adenylyltransferase